MSNRIALIMAGGSGERFWPLSRQDCPKQLLRITNPERSMLAETVTRIQPIIPTDSTFVITGMQLSEAIRNSSELDLPQQNILAEPQKRNTTGALIYAAADILARDGEHAAETTMAVLTADHQVGDDEAYRDSINAALEAAEKSDTLVTLGVTPSRPETGYGYIELPQSMKPTAYTNNKRPVYNVEQFREKPDAETAETYLESGRFLWNSGMFFWRLRTFLDQLRCAQPDMYQILVDVSEALEKNDQAAAAQRFSALEDVSIDYALMERAQNVSVVPADFPWDDVGAWDALDRTMPKDEQGNVSIGEPILLNTTESIVYNAPGKERMTVAVAGCSGLAVIVAEDAVLVIPKDQAQDVKKIVQAVKKESPDKT